MQSRAQQELLPFLQVCLNEAIGLDADVVYRARVLRSRSASANKIFQWWMEACVSLRHIIALIPLLECV